MNPPFLRLACVMLAIPAGLAAAAFRHDAAALPKGYPETPRRQFSLNQNWSFHRGDLATAPTAADFDDSSWESVNVPHTLALTSLSLDGVKDSKFQETFHRDIAWYRRTFSIDPTGGSRVFLQFEGAHQVTDVWVNGEHVGQHNIGGYTPFAFDITAFVQPNQSNHLVLRLDNRSNPHTPPDPGPFDYVKFSGLYRDVYLVQKDPVHVTTPWDKREAGVTITTPTVHPEFATVAVRTNVHNAHPSPRDVSVLTRVINTDNEVVIKVRDTATIAAGTDHTFSQLNGIEHNLRHWSPDSPYLYRVNTTIFDGDEAVDVVENPLGIRKIELRRDIGLFLNDQPITLIGTNRHQHYGYIGDAMPDSLHRQDALQFKRAGFNVVRLAHYPHDDAFLEACDELGLLVYEEAPSWIAIGDAEWHRRLELAERRAIRNHRNHPSVFIWGAGINHRSTIPALHFAAKDEDPTRLTASNNAQWTGYQGAGFADVLTNMDYSHKGEPDEMTFLSEHGASRDAERNQIYVSRYLGSPRRFGMAAWTAHAYYTFHPDLTAEDRTRGGMMTVFRDPGAVIEWYRSELTTTPMVFIADPWQPDTQQLRVFSNAEEVELRVNGRSLGRHRPTTHPEKRNLNSPPFVIPVTYEPGTVEARAWRGGEIVATHQLHTPGEPVGLEFDLQLDQRQWIADGSDIVAGHVRVVDAHGTTVPSATPTITFATEGPAAVVGDANIGANPLQPKNGRAPVLFRAGINPGEVSLMATAPGLKPARTTLTTHPFQPDIVLRRARPIHDYETVQVDLGAADQLVQFDWTPWFGEELQGSVLDLPRFPGARAKVRAATPDGIARWRGESNVIGRDGYVAGDGICVLGGDGLELILSDLPAGDYQLTTFHHVPHSNTNSMDPAKDNPEDADFRNIESATHLSFTLANSSRSIQPPRDLDGVKVGTNMGKLGPSAQVMSFTVSPEESVTITIRDATMAPRSAAVWLNGFKLRRALTN